ncbi:MAG: NAD+ synthase [Candidatus Latescibacterota bacterium]
MVINEESVASFLGVYINEQLEASGLDRVVVGLSGGLDSATSAYLAVRALGSARVKAFLLPYRTSSPQSKAHALLAVAALGIEAQEIEIAPVVDPYIERFPEMDRLRRGNLMARARMMVVYDQSAAHRALVLGTGNKTEALLGYTTLWGDMACAFTPIGDLYKTEVRQLARYLGVPTEIIEKQPSADLWVGQTDEEEIGLTYEEMDALLVRLVDQGMDGDEVARLGFEPEKIAHIQGMIRCSEFKRRMPLSPKIPETMRKMTGYGARIA